MKKRIRKRTIGFITALTLLASVTAVQVTAEELSLEETGYSEVVYISNAEELLAIDSHDGGYYELTADIDISGMEWEPLTLTNATFNGNGHTISGMTITRDPGENYIEEAMPDIGEGDENNSEGQTINGLGLFNGCDNYVYEVDMINVSIDLTIPSDSEITVYENISVFGAANLDSCMITGSISVTDLREEGEIYVYGFYNGSKCEAELDITVEKAYNTYGSVHVSGLERCTDSEFVGNISVDGASAGESLVSEITGIKSCRGCSFYGDISLNGTYSSAADVCGINDSENSTCAGDIRSAKNAYGIKESDNSSFGGNITAVNEAFCIWYSKNSTFEGDVESDYAYCIAHSSNCSAKGDVTVSGEFETPVNDVDSFSVQENVDINEELSNVTIMIAHSNDSVFEGRLLCKGKGIAAGIYGSGDCIMTGSITADAGGVGFGIMASNSCRFYGNIKGDDAVGMYISNNCRFYGDLKGSDSVIGINGGDNCLLYGDIKSEEYIQPINGCTECSVYGNAYGSREMLIENGGKYSVAIFDSKDCYMSGSMSITGADHPVLVINADSPMEGFFRCEYCGAEMTATSDLERTAHCYTYSIDSDGDLETVPHYYKLVKAALYEAYSNEGDDDETEDEPTAEPTDEPVITYTLQITDEQSEAPLAGAEVNIGGETHITDENGVIVIKDPLISGGVRIDYGGAAVYTDPSFEPMPNRMNVIKVKPLQLEKGDIFAGNDASVVLQGPSINVAGYEMPAFEMPFSIDYELFDELKIAYDAEDKCFQVLIGGEKELADVELDANSTSWKKTFEEFKEEYRKSKEDRSYNGNTDLNGTLGIHGGIDTHGFMEIRAGDDGSMSVDGGMTVALQGSAEHYHYLIPGVYLVFSLSGEIGGELNWEIVNTSPIDPKIDVLGTVAAELSPSVGAGAGFQSLLALELGLKGTLGVEYSFPGYALEEALRAELNADFYAALYALNHPYTHSFRLAGVQLYPDLGAAEPLSLDDPDMYTIDREYLNEVSLFNDDPGTFKTNLYPYSEVQTASLDDGRIMAVWTDDDTSRNSMDRTALYYSIYENGAWSAAEQIADDGTGDYEFDLQSSGGTAAIVWQNAEQQLPDDISVDDNAALVGLSYAVYDGSAWGVPVNITEGNTGYEYSPKLYYDGYDGYIAWMENSRNAAFPAAGDSISVYSITASGGETGEKTTEYEDMRLVYEIEIGSEGRAACIADSDGDSSTADGVLYVDGMECHTGGALSGLEYADGGFCFSDNGTLRQSDGLSSYAREISTTEKNTAPRLVTNSATGAKAIVYEVQEEFASNLYASYYTDGSWSAPVRITEHEEKLRSWSAELDEDGNIIVAAVLAAVDVADDELRQSVRLSFETAQPKEEIEVIYVSSDGAAPGETAEFEIRVRNDSLAEMLNVMITDESGAVLYSGTETAAETITVSADIPEDFARQTVTVYVDGAENESDTSDNSASMVFGTADLSAELRGSAVTKTGTVSAVVTNNGCEPAENTVLRLKDADGNVIAEESLGTIAGCEKRTVRAALDKSLYTFEDSYGSTLISAEAVSDTEEAVSWNNSTYYMIKAADGISLRLESGSTGMAPGEIYTPALSVYPEGIGAEIYCTSSDESVAAVDEDGAITAVGEGTAVISYMTPGALIPAKLTVYVRETGTPEITEAACSGGNVSVTVDTSSCLAEGESEQLITAVYGDDGTLIGMSISEVTAAAANTVSVSVSGGSPAKVKAMLWSGTAGMKPASYAAERAVDNNTGNYETFVS